MSRLYICYIDDGIGRHIGANLARILAGRRKLGWGAWSEVWGREYPSHRGSGLERDLVPSPEKNEFFA